MITNSKMQNIEFLRFLFAVIIVLYHSGNATHDGYLAVEIFFILAGYFLAKSFAQKPDITYSTFIKNKLARLWPLFAFAVILNGGNLYDMVFKLLFLHSTGITLKYKSFIWFVAPFFWTMLGYFIILKSFKFNNALSIISLLTYLSYVYLINWNNGNLNIRETVNFNISLAMLRGIAGIGFGIIIQAIFQNINLPVTHSKIRFFLITLIEICILYFFIYHMIFKTIKYDNKLIFIIFFAILLFLFIQKQGLLSQLLENKYSEMIGRYAYAIYIMQNLGFKIADSLSIGYPLANQLIIIIILGILGYHLIEKPIYQKLRRTVQIELK